MLTIHNYRKLNNWWFIDGHSKIDHVVELESMYHFMIDVKSEDVYRVFKIFRNKVDGKYPTEWMGVPHTPLGTDDLSKWNLVPHIGKLIENI